jgi:hypothetical protein
MLPGLLAQSLGKLFVLPSDTLLLDGHTYVVGLDVGRVALATEKLLTGYLVPQIGDFLVGIPDDLV